MRSTVPINNNAKVLIPGDPKREAYKVRMEQGIPLHWDVIQDLKNISSYTGIKFE